MVSAKARAAQGIIPPKWVYPYVINDARNVITGEPFGDCPDAPLFADFKAKVAKLAISQIEKDMLISDAAQAPNASVKPAYEALIAELPRRSRSREPMTASGASRMALAIMPNGLPITQPPI